MLYQAFICIATYHNMVNFVFENITIDNFLVQTNDYKGYYHYIYNDKEFYIKSCDYNIIINDFGNSQFIDIDDDDSKKKILQNYIEVVEIFQVKFNLQISKLESNTPAINTAIDTLKKYLQNIDLKTTPFSFDNIIQDVFNIIKVEAKEKDNPIYITNTKISILNSQTPFIISKQVDEDEDLEKSKLLLIKTINKVILTTDEIKLKRDLFQTYMLYRGGLRDGVNALVNNIYLKEISSDGIRKIVVNNDQQISVVDQQILDNINSLLSKMDNTKKKVEKKYDSLDYTKFQNFIPSKIKEIEEDLKTFSAHVKSLSFYKALSGGKSAPKYKSTGKVVYILYKKKKYKRTIYVKDKRKTKYCKINNEYILLSKLKIIE